jgi:hypothetical protein
MCGSGKRDGVDAKCRRHRMLHFHFNAKSENPTSMEQATIDDSSSYIGIDTIIEHETNSNQAEDHNVIITTTQEQQTQQSFLPMSDFRVPPELQIPLIVLVRLNHLLPVLISRYSVIFNSHFFGRVDLLISNLYPCVIDCTNRFLSYTRFIVSLGTKKETESD